MGLLTNILASPVNGLTFIFKQIQSNVERELYDETIWQQKLIDLQMRYDIGELDEVQYHAQEEAIVSQLDLINSMYSDYDEEEEEDYEDYDEEEELPVQPEVLIDVLPDPVYFTAH